MTIIEAYLTFKKSNKTSILRKENITNLKNPPAAATGIDRLKRVH